MKKQFDSAGEAAFFHSSGYRPDDGGWEYAQKDMWEAAASGAISHAQQFAAAAQVAYFTAGAAVPYHVNDSGQIFTAQITDPYTGAVTLSMHEIPYREIATGSVENATDWFKELVRTQDGRPSSLMFESTRI
ncbi:hypothetical protein [Pseudomonas amygdali]|uniref:hypothetical protein n=1 Tax=Pseudomonas amygdali TaxID=47877 RepID=UPI0006E5775D|nr:hypothetical protein [Pseudomonas amygdali]KPY55692.1 hypothetical protein ALO93_200279 [Pseudomonas amygdali pv. sesami]